jgi:ComF family protein
MDLALASSFARRLAGPVLAVVFPSECPACGQLILQLGRGPLCEPCWESLPRHHASSCRCGLPLAPGLASCPRCRRGHHVFAAGTSLGPYEGALRVAIHELKFSGRRRAAARLAELLLESPATRALVETSDVLVPVPLHPRRLRERGFNQAELLAHELGRRVARPSAPDALVRRLDTAPQAGLSASARRRNVRAAFAVRSKPKVAGKTVTLVDDVVTTGATALACGRELLAAGAREVRLLSVARVA